MYFVSIYESRITKPVEIVLRRGRKGRGRTMEAINLTKIHVSTYVCITMYPPVQLSYASRIF
jgi:hypothetical protein